MTSRQGSVEALVLGAGQEVGRSCVVVTLGDKRVKAGKMALDDAIEEIRQALVPYWQLCLSAYLFYVSGDGDMTDGGITNFCPRQNS